MKWVFIIPSAIIMGIIGMGLTAIVFLAGVSARQSSPRYQITSASVGMRLTPIQETGCGELATYMNYDRNVVRAWCAAEGNVGNPGQPANNLLFLSCGVPEQIGCVTLNGRQWAVFPSVEVGAVAMWNNLARNPKLYAGILTAANTDPMTEMQAIALSPWDAGHYGDPPGTHLINAYDTLRGIRISCPGAHVCAE